MSTFHSHMFFALFSDADKVIALYPYKAQNDDELSFEKDDIISVLGRDEPEWWRGECQGLTGLFPSNYVGPFVTSGEWFFFCLARDRLLFLELIANELSNQ